MSPLGFLNWTGSSKKPVVIRVKDIVGGNIPLISPQLGGRVCDAIAVQLKRGENIQVLFEGTGHVFFAFLNTAIGKLYDRKTFDSFDQEDIDRLVTFPDADPYLQEKIHVAVVAAKKFYGCKEKLLNIFEER